jgi:uncharacterized protein (DUF1501 family)
MKRRDFLKASGSFSLPVLIGGINVRAIAASPLFTFMNSDNDKILVLIQLNGGNDGLNTIIPMESYDNLANVRQNLIIPESSLLTIENNNALHPAMTRIKDMFDNAKVGIVQGVAYPNQNRSHFRSTDIWVTGSDANEYLTTGWLGRYLQDQHPDFPEGYPNDDCPDPLAITMGPLVSETCQGLVSNFSMAISDLNAVTTVNEVGGDDIPDNCYGEELVFLRQAIAQTNAYADTIIEAADAGSNMATYPQNNGLARQLRQVAQLISGGLQTRIYVVSIGGFDTHAAQVEDGDPLSGIHAGLLEEVSDAVYAFHDDLTQQGLSDRVLSMTFSEFGRQIASNFSLGTDHGTAAPMFLFGDCVKPGFTGDNPEISDQLEPQAGVAMQYDFRSVYGTVLTDWFEVPEDKVRSLLYQDFQRLSLINGCEPTSTDDLEFSEELQLRVYPNPFGDQFNLQFHSKGGEYQISLFDMVGHEVVGIASREFPEGQHNIVVRASNLPRGNYALRIADRYNVRSQLIVKGR